MVHVAIPPAAERPNLLNGLVTKRAELSGRIHANEEEHCLLLRDLRALDATIYLFEPAVDVSEIKPKPVAQPHRASFGEITRIVLDTLRESTRAMTSCELAMVVLQERQLDEHDATLRSLLRKRVGACLLAHKNRGNLRSIPGRPLLTWEIAQ